MESYKQINPDAYLESLPDVEREMVQNDMEHLQRLIKREGNTMMDAIHLTAVKSRVECAERGEEEADEVKYSFLFYNAWAGQDN